MNNNSAEKIGNNQDLLTQILLRLPVKSTIRFECVSKKWLSLISSPHFCLSHTRRQRHGKSQFLEPDALLLKLQFLVSRVHFDVAPLKYYCEVPLFDYISKYINLLQSCNGLFLCESFNFDHDFVYTPVTKRHLESTFFICNPTTKKFKKLSLPRSDFLFREFCSISLAFDPLKSPHYKIIVVRQVSETNPWSLGMDIYASETDHWDESSVVFEADSVDGIAFDDVVFCNEKIHWNSHGNESLYFDVEKACVRKMPMPARLNDLPTNRYFGETNGSLHLAVAYHGIMALSLDVHQMAPDYSHWFLKHRVHLLDAIEVLPELNSGCYPFSARYSGVSFVQSEQGDEARIVMWVDGKIICYDFGCEAWKMLIDPGPGLEFGTDVPDRYAHYHEKKFLAYKYFCNLSCI